VIRGHAVMTSTGADPGLLAAARNLKNMQQLGGKKFPLDEAIHFL